MGMEIERNFLLKNNAWNASGVKPLVLQQGYIMISKTEKLRIRTSDSNGFITVKGRTRHASHLEYEYEIPIKNAEEKLNELSKKPLVEREREHRPWGISMVGGSVPGRQPEACGGGNRA